MLIKDSQLLENKLDLFNLPTIKALLNILNIAALEIFIVINLMWPIFASFFNYQLWLI